MHFKLEKSKNFIFIIIIQIILKNLIYLSDARERIKMIIKKYYYIVNEITILFVSLLFKTIAFSFDDRSIFNDRSHEIEKKSK